jgi:AraC family transcriptional regulator
MTCGMKAQLSGSLRASASTAATAALAVRPIVGGDGWSVSEFVCSAGPDDRSVEERHNGYSIAAVIEGCFTYRAGKEASLLYPGALLLGNSRACYACRHDHSVGDRCISFSFDEDAFNEIAVSSGARKGFRRPMLPASHRLAPLFAAIESLSWDASPLRAEEIGVAVAETAVADLEGGVRTAPAPVGWEARRITDTLRLIEERPEEATDLAKLARIAGLSRHHFLRVFRRSVGMTPHQYLLRVRMARAARKLVRSREPVISIALDSGFGDLSTFNARFRATFGMTPTRYRAANG